VVEDLRVFNHVGFFGFRLCGKRPHAGSVIEPLFRSLIVFTSLATLFAPVLGDGTYVYWGGGGIGLIVVVVIIVLLLRR
jgi:hypothetical protein